MAKRNPVAKDGVGKRSAVGGLSRLRGALRLQGGQKHPLAVCGGFPIGLCQSRHAVDLKDHESSNYQ